MDGGEGAEMSSDVARVATRIAIRNEKRIALLTIERAAKLNALDRPTIRALGAAATSLAQDANLRAVVITGQGERAFVGGADIDTMAKLDAAGAESFIAELHEAIARVRDIPVTAWAPGSNWPLRAISGWPRTMPYSACRR